MKIPENIKTRICAGGRLRKELQLVFHIKKEYPKSNYAQITWKKFLLKYFLGSRHVNYNHIFTEAWNKLFPNNAGDHFDIMNLKFVNDNAFKIEFSDIFISSNYLNISDFSEDKIVAKKIISLLSVEGPYEFGNTKIFQNDVVIDAGANMGLFSLYCLLMGAKKVYAFEPQKSVLHILNENIQNNNADDSIEIIPLGLSDKTAEYKLSHSPTGHEAASIVLERNSRNDIETIQCVSLDDWVSENKIDRIDFLKADIEGSERYMLQGGKKILKEIGPRLAICTYHFKDDPKIIEEIILDANPKYKIHHTSHKLFAYIPN